MSFQVAAISLKIVRKKLCLNGWLVLDNPLGGRLKGEELACAHQFLWAWGASYRFIQVPTNKCKGCRSKFAWLPVVGLALQ